MPIYFLGISKHRNKKYYVRLLNSNKTIHFGDIRYEDYTTHKDIERKHRYLLRHYKNEDWDITGIDTPGFWSRWVLWNKSTLKQSINDLKKKFNIEVHILK